MWRPPLSTTNSRSVTAPSGCSLSGRAATAAKDRRPEPEELVDSVPYKIDR
jgi:hypothetical protein